LLQFTKTINSDSLLIFNFFRSIKMNSLTTLSSLNNDCLELIFVNLPLIDLIALLSVCCDLNNAVAHYLSKVDKLSVFLSALQCSKHSRYDSINIIGDVRKFTFGPENGRYVRVWEKDTMLAHQSHFRSEEFLILSDMNRFGTFLQFVVKHLRGITKLALIIDHRKYFNKKFVPCLLRRLPNKDFLKVLLVERTLRDSCIFQEDSKFYWNRLKVIQQPFYSSILSLSSLEELYFFPKRDSQIVIANRPPNGDNGSKFVNTILPRLRVFHINSHFNNHLQAYPRAHTIRFEPRQIYTKLHELKFWCLEMIGNVADFPNMKTLHFYDNGDLDELNISALQNLRSLRVHFRLNSFSENDLNTLNKLPNIEKLECLGISHRLLDISAQFQPNWTIKHIVMWLDPSDEANIEEYDNRLDIADYRTIFPALETLQYIKTPEMIREEWDKQRGVYIIVFFLTCLLILDLSLSNCSNVET